MRGQLLIILFFGDNSSYSTARILSVSFSSGYQVKMYMEYGLAGGLSNIDANVEAVNAWELFGELFLADSQQVVQPVHFISAGIKKIGIMALWNDQGVSFCNRVFVENNNAVIIFEQYLSRVDLFAEFTFRIQTLTGQFSKICVIQIALGSVASRAENLEVGVFCLAAL